MLILGIESSCDETAAAVVEDGRIILSNIVATQIDTHAAYGGVVPEIASRLHTENITLVVKEAVAKSGKSMADIAAVAVTFAPGLIGPLLVGVNFAKGICFKHNKPLVPVHHIKGHIAANFLSNNDLEPPFLCLVVSGGHSHIIEVCSHTEFKVIGMTRDDAAGEAFDKAARTLGFGYPGGVLLDKLASSGDTSAVKLPKPHAPAYDYSFSGLKTAVINFVHNAEQKGEIVNKANVAASFQETVATLLTDKFICAAEDLGYKTLALAGGVSANSALRKRLEVLCHEKGYHLYMPPHSLCGDNAAMIAAQGYYEFKCGNVGGMDLNALPYLPVDEIVKF